MDVRYDGFVWTGLMWLRIGTSGRFLEHGYKLSDSLNVGKFLMLHNWRLFKNDSSTWSQFLIDVHVIGSRNSSRLRMHYGGAGFRVPVRPRISFVSTSSRPSMRTT
jgi:hypothetical protein